MKYDPLGNRVWRYVDSTATTRKYVVDIAGRLPTILCEIDGSSLTKSYIYSNTSQILCQRDGGQSADEYFYVTDRLGSVRQVVGIVDEEPAVVLSYTYSPFGQMVEQGKKTGFEYSFNSFLFTGQWFDSEFGQYYLRARMYDPVLGRFTSRDPVTGNREDPMTLHPYLYCLNDPTNRIDPDGEISAALIIVGGIVGGVSAAITSGCDEWSDASAILFGIGTGMFAGMLPSSLMGVYGGMLLSAANTAYATWMGGGDMDDLGLNLFFGAAGAGIGGPAGALFKSAGAFAYLTSAAVGGFYSWASGETYEGGEGLTEYKDFINDITDPRDF